MILVDQFYTKYNCLLYGSLLKKKTSLLTKSREFWSSFYLDKHMLLPGLKTSENQDDKFKVKPSKYGTAAGYSNIIFGFYWIGSSCIMHLDNAVFRARPGVDDKL